MPEHLDLGVYLDETRRRGEPIKGVPTSICAFIGLTVSGPVGVVSEMLSSVTDYTQIYGGRESSAFDSGIDALYRRNYMAHAVQAFFDSGGRQLYVVRVAWASTACAF